MTTPEPTIHDPSALGAPRTGNGLEQELLNALARQARRVPVPVMVTALASAGLAYHRVPTWLIVAWVALVAALQVVRVIVITGLARRVDETTASRLRVASLLSLVNGLVHASSLGFFPFLSEIERAVQSMLMIGMATGTAGTTIGYRPFFVAFVAPLLGTLALAWIITPAPGLPDWVRVVVPLLLTMLGFVLYSLAHETFAAFRQAFDSRQRLASLNAQLQRALVAEEAANRSKTRFLASASHDLRQPLHALSLFGAALMLRPLDPKSAEIANKMDEAIRDLASEMDTLLDISKLDAGVLAATPERFDLARVLRRLVDTFGEAARRKSLALSLDAPPTLVVETDRVLLERVLRNLVDNAVKYTDHGSVRIRAETRPEGCVVRVEDTGRGIPPAEQERVFEEFYQVGNPERDRRKGLGLGLSIVHRLMPLLGARLEMDSVIGRGTRFAVHLPVAADEDERPAPSLAPGAYAGVHILVVDDEESVRLAMRELLQAMGCRVSDAGSTVEAIARSAEAAPDLVLADLRLRGEDNGIATIRALRATVPGLAALLVSGDTAPDRLREAKAAGIKLLHKPVPVDVLTAEIERALASSARR